MEPPRSKKIEKGLFTAPSRYSLRITPCGIMEISHHWTVALVTLAANVLADELGGR